jgi:hypothetical protein
MTGRTNEEAVSVIVGTLLLLLLTVTAAAGLAIMVAQLQKNEMDHQSHLAAVQSEEIVIADPVLSNDFPAWNQTNSSEWNQTPFTIPGNQSWKNWSSVTITLSNMNTDDVRVIGIAIGDWYSRNYSTVTDTIVPVWQGYNISADYLTIPGGKSRKIRINFTNDFPLPQYIPEDEPIRIKVITSLYNTFDTVFRPPNPVFLTRVEKEDLGVVERHVLVLDGSASTADTRIVDWNWSIMSAGATIPVPGTWVDTTNLTQVYYRGMIARINPPDPGPFRASLTVTDTSGMSRTSEPVDIPSDKNFIPVANVFASRFNSTLLGHDIVNVTVKDINGNPVPGVTVNFAIGSNPYNSLLFGPYYNITGSDGVAMTEVFAGNGTVKAICGEFPVMDVQVGL